MEARGTAGFSRWWAADRHGVRRAGVRALDLVRIRHGRKRTLVRQRQAGNRRSSRASALGSPLVVSLGITIMAPDGSADGAVLGAVFGADDADLVWHDAPNAWHQSLARIVDHRFYSLDRLRAFALDA